MNLKDVVIIIKFIFLQNIQMKLMGMFFCLFKAIIIVFLYKNTIWLLQKQRPDTEFLINNGNLVINPKQAQN